MTKSTHHLLSIFIGALSFSAMVVALSLQSPVANAAEQPSEDRTIPLPPTMTDLAAPINKIDPKYNPGHYIAMNLRDRRQQLEQVIEPGVVGVQVRYTWAELEPEIGRYDFSRIEADIEFLAANNRQLIALIMDKSFLDEPYTPSYLWDDYTLPSNSSSGGHGYVAKRWDPYIVDRMSALFAAMGDAFDSHPNFEGIAIQESAIGLSAEDQERFGYNPAAYRDALICTLQRGAVAIPNSRMFWYMNFLVGNNGYLADIAAEISPFGVGIGGPDVLPGLDSLERFTYPVLRSVEGTVRFNSAQNDSFRHERETATGAPSFWTPGEIFEYARDNLGVGYMLWNRKPFRDSEETFSVDDALQVIESQTEYNRSISSAATRTYGERLASTSGPAFYEACGIN